MPDTDYLTLGEAAEVVRLSTSTLCKLRCNGGGPKFIRAGRKILYRRADLVAWLEAKTFGSTSEYGREVA